MYRLSRWRKLPQCWEKLELYIPPNDGDFDECILGLAVAPGSAGEIKLYDVPDKEAAMIMAIVILCVMAILLYALINLLQWIYQKRL